MANEKILVVDDEANIRLLCEEILTRNGYFPTCVETPMAALRAARGGEFDLLMTDISMPEMDGLELLGTIRETDEDLPAVIITGHGRLEQAIRSLHLGAQSFIVKPFTQQELLGAVHETLEKNRLMKENVRLKSFLPLFEISQNLHLEVNLPTLFEQLVTVALRETGSDQVVLLMEEEGADLPEIKAIFPPLDEAGRWRQRKIFKKMARKVVERKEVIRSEGAEPLDEENAVFLARSGFSSFLSSPLHYEGKVSGVISLFKQAGRGFYRQSDVELISILSGQAVTAIENAKLFEQLEKSHFESMKALAQAIEAKDLYTRGHCDRMVKYALAVGDRLGLSLEEKKHLGYGAALHDIGKIGVHELVLNKRGKLTEKEYEMMKDHPMFGAEIIKGVEFLEPVAPMIYSHQERYDGLGYPLGLSGEAIPIGARIIAVLDTFDAMTSDRSYRRALPVDVAFSELRRCMGSQFDPQVVQAFIEMMQESQRDPS
ncbi:MAG: HD domain-containing phosphohydrolase [Candidatus Manganitrophaceae bacterium]